MNDNSIIKKKDNVNAGIVVKAGTWYTICNFLFRGISFITTPLFTRIMSKEEIGSFSNFSSWLSILTILTSFDLAQSIIRSKLEHEEDIDRYISSIMAFTNLSTACAFVVVNLFPGFFENLLQMDMQYIQLMFLYLFLTPAYQMFITKHRAFYRYKSFILLTGIVTVSSTLLSLLMVCILQNKLTGRIYGYCIPYILISLCLYVNIMAKGKGIKMEYWKYACTICLPLVPHVLSLYLLGSSDKIIITKFCGLQYTAIYSVAYNCYHIVTIIFDSMNKAWAPWLLDRLHENNYKIIYIVSKKYICVFCGLVIGALLFVPEIIMILGGRDYIEAIYCLPPLIISCVFQFLYTMYVNIEFYRKKTIGVAAATFIAATINIILNLIFIPLNIEKGYIIASYTTLVGYIVLFIFHYLLVKKMKMDFIYDIKFIITTEIFVFLISCIMSYLYNCLFLRYILAFFYCVVIMVLLCKNRKFIYSFFKKE